MYTLYISDENDVTVTVKETIMERSNYVDDIQILVNRYYKGTYDMSTMSCYMRYTLPISSKIKNIELTLNDTAYGGEDVLQYVIPANTVLTSEEGNVEVTFTWLLLEADSDGNYTEYVRKTTSGVITIIPLVQFAKYVPDELLDEVDQRLLTMTGQITDLNALIETAMGNMVNDVVLTDDNSAIVLKNDIGTVGSGVSMDDLVEIIGTELVGTDADGTTDGISYLDEATTTTINLDDVV